MNLNKSIVKLNGLFYNLSEKINEKILENDIYKIILPGDEVEYVEENSIIKINNITKRNNQITLGILKGKNISLPLLSPIFLQKNKNILELDFYKTYLILCEVELEGINILEVFGEINDRKNDCKIIQKIYRMRDENFENIYHNLIIKSNLIKPLYTIQERVDLTYLETFNIDPFNSKDFDDAISVIPNQNKIYVHIVDIHNNLEINSKEEKDAFFYGFSLYTQEGNLNIFPEELSENKFSLIKNEKRNVITFEFKLTSNLRIESYEIYPSVIKIKKRYNYEEAEKELQKGDNDLSFLKRVIIDNNNDDWKFRSMDIPKRYLKIKENIIEGIDIRCSGNCNKIIEGLMIQSNKIITEFLKTKTDILPQRFHEKSKIESVAVENITDNDLINNLFAIKKYKTAIYSNQRESHYGLKLEKYTHFTSPIRRGLDILVHRILGGIIYEKKSLDEMIEHLNKRETLNEKLINFYEKLKLYSYFEKNADIKYVGYIMNVNKNGINVYIPDVMHYEFIHVSKIEPNIRFKFEDNKLLNISKNVYLKMGDKIDIKFKTINWTKLCINEYECSLTSK